MNKATINSGLIKAHGKVSEVTAAYAFRLRNGRVLLNFADHSGKRRCLNLIIKAADLRKLAKLGTAVVKSRKGLTRGLPKTILIKKPEEADGNEGGGWK